MKCYIQLIDETGGTVKVWATFHDVRTMIQTEYPIVNFEFGSWGLLQFTDRQIAEITDMSTWVLAVYPWVQECGPVTVGMMRAAIKGLMGAGFIPETEIKW